MRPTLTAVALLLATVCLVSCNNDGAASDSGNAQDAPAAQVVSREEAATVRLARLAREDGQKWTMDDHTRSIFAQMASTFQETNPASLDEQGRMALGAALDTQLKELIRGCTMTGEAHDQLHVFLAGYLPAVVDLAKTGQIEDARAIGRYLGGYDRYFE